MELRVLRYFLMVAREENITKAANLLHVTQPTLSRQLMQLEQELDVKLFERSSHNIVLTEDGMLLKRRAQEMITLEEKTKQEFLKTEETLSGEITLGAGEMLGVNPLVRLMCDFQKENPHVHFDLYSGNADIVKERIENGLLDMGLLIEPVDIGKYEFLRVPVREQWGVFVTKDSPLADKTSIRPEDLVGQPLLVTNRSLVQNEVFNWFGDYAEQMNIVATYNLMYNCAMAVEEGMGIMIGIKLNVNYGKIRFIPLEPVLEVGTVLAWKKSQIFSPAVTSFISYAKQCLQSMTPYKG